MLLRVALTQINPDSRQGYTKGASRRGDAVSRQRGAGGSGKAHGHPPGNAKEQGSRGEKGDAPEPLRPQRSPPLRLAALTSPLPRASRGGGAEALPCRARPRRGAPHKMAAWGRGPARGGIAHRPPPPPPAAPLPGPRGKRRPAPPGCGPAGHASGSCR